MLAAFSEDNGDGTETEADENSASGEEAAVAWAVFGVFVVDFAALDTEIRS